MLKLILVIIAFANCNTLLAREICSENYETIKELQNNIQNKYPLQEDGSLWKSFNDKTNSRMWYFSKNQADYQAAICRYLTEDSSGLKMGMNVTCFGSTATCDNVNKIWNENTKALNESFQASMKQKSDKK